MKNLFLAIFLIQLISVISAKNANVEIQVEDFNFLFAKTKNEANKDFTQIEQGQKHKKTLEINLQQSVKIKFSVKNKQTKELMNVHQAFIGFIHKTTQQELIYVAKMDKKTKLYTFELNMNKNYEDFAGISGKYSIVLILGDATVTNPVYWEFADSLVTVPKKDPVVIPKSRQINTEKLPEIQHQFAKPETRPSQIVSDAFTVLCLLPILILFILWFRIGINFKNVHFSLWGLGFHMGLIGIFVLYFFYWIELNMFETLQYLSAIGTFTFVCGNRFLHNFNNMKKQKIE